MAERIIAVEERLGRVETSIEDLRTFIAAEIQRAMVNHESPQSSGTTVTSSLDEFRLSSKKVELPAFTGDDPVAWITRAETYFEVQRISQDVRIQLTKLSMEDPTIHWFNLWRDSTEELSWEKLYEEMMARFGGRRLENPFEELKDLKQSETVEDYIAEFKLCSSQYGRLPEQQFLDYFIGGLHHDIHSRLRTFKPHNRYVAMQLARDVEREFAENSGHGSGSRYKPGHGSWTKSQKPNWAFHEGEGKGSAIQTHTNNYLGKTRTSSGSGSQTGSTRPTNSTTSSRPNLGDNLRRHSRGVRHLPSAEVNERRAKGLCFRCSERWDPLHQCATKQLRLIILGDDEIVNDEGEIVVLEAESEEDLTQEELECKTMGLFGVSTNLNQVRTMKLEGCLHGASILVLIDSGATHNFISPKVVETLGLPMVPSNPLGVKLGDGHRVLPRGRCNGIQLNMGAVQICFDAYVLELGGVDLILGVVWLETLGKVTMDWKEMSMVFNHKGSMVKLLGQAVDDTMATFQSIITPSRMIAGCEWPTLMKVLGSPMSRVSDHQTKELGGLLDHFVIVFKEIQGLPPPRNTSHSIELLHGACPVSVRPYRYPHLHKDELEKQIQSLMQQGVVRNCTNAFSSPVILVKKKD
ncbi:uncharacterized protein LOC127130207 [Lathyrus oleraceus]|uniref:uncharacterized protein LOC127130207 n=1 Tax=Pisum sativum TaxID=3888 RepID=UPI0021D156AD|nr:uncharacterized protein LOC127130207 [Pisum sativum]